jgi:hypothetical protein
VITSEIDEEQCLQSSEKNMITSEIDEKQKLQSSKKKYQIQTNFLGKRPNFESTEPNLADLPSLKTSYMFFEMSMYKYRIEEIKQNKGLVSCKKMFQKFKEQKVLKLFFSKIQKIFQRIEIDSIKEIFDFLENQLFLRQDDNESQFNNLGPKSKQILCILLNKIFKKTGQDKIKSESFRYEDFKVLRNPKNEMKGNAHSQKRNEEYLKFVLKRILKILKKNFRSEYSSLKLQYLRQHKLIFEKTGSSFFFWLLKETITNNSEDLDLVMDIMYGIPRVNKTLYRHKNWSHIKSSNTGTIKKVSGAILHLMYNDVKLREKINSVINDSSFERFIKNQIKQKLNNMKSNWIDELKNCDNRFLKFKEQIETKINTNSFKICWSLERCRTANGFFKTKFNDDPRQKSQKEFDNIKHYHYSSQKRMPN